MARLESKFGNVASGEAVLQEFYTAYQEENESVTDWGLRLEHILQRAREKGHVTEDRMDKMLRDKFWRSLYDSNLRNATKLYHKSASSFDQLQGEVRAEEYDMKEYSARQQQPQQRKDRKNPVQHQPHLTEADDQISLLKSIAENMSRMDRDIQQLKRGQSRGGWRPRNRGRSRGYGKQNGRADAQTKTMKIRKQKMKLNRRELQMPTRAI